MSSSAIRLTALCKAYGSRVVLDDVSASIAPGRIVSLVGPSGCGKTTLLRCLNALVPLDSGAIDIAGHRLVAGLAERDLDRIRRDVGTVFQDFQLFPQLSALGNVALAPRVVRKLNRADADAGARRWLERVGLADRAEARPSELSGGQKQRVALARALAQGARVLLLDEPTSALDAASRDAIRDLLHQLRSDPALAADGSGPASASTSLPLTVLVVTHDLRFAEHLADELWTLEHGRLKTEVNGASAPFA